jgi:two-component system, cell cycle sensor histidine kinase and response regulator CckA
MWTRGLARTTSSGGHTWPLWTAAALWGFLAAGSLVLLSEVREEQAVQDADLAWLRDADRLSESLALLSNQVPRAVAVRPEASPGWLLDALGHRGLLERVPLPAEAAADARRDWEIQAPLVRQAVLAAGPAPRALATGALPALEPLQAAVTEVRVAVRAHQGEVHRRLESLWTQLLVLGTACVLGVGVLCVVLFRRHAQTGALLESQAALAESENRFRTLVQTAQDLIWSVDTGGRWTFVNEAVRRILGYAPEDLLGRPFFAVTAPDQVDADRAMFDAVLGGKTVLQHETVHVRRDGRPVTLLVNATSLRDRLGEVVGATGTAADVTGLIELRERVRHTDRLQALGVLAGGVAHDFNNLLTGVIGNAGFAREDRDDPARQGKDLDAIEGIAQRGRTLTRQLLAFARKQVLKPEVLDLVRTARDQHDFLKRLLGEDVTLRTEVPPHPLWVRADRTQIEQVLLNLCVNSRDAFRDGRGRITVTLGSAVVSPTEAQALGIAPGPWTRLDVEDDGEGMDEPTQRQLFEPFFTTKPGGKGTGLGLSTVYGIVHQHGGTITVASSPGQGTLMRVLLQPCPAPTGDAEPATEERAPVFGAGARVLVVEDDPLVREVVHRILADARFEVESPADPLRALEALRDDGRAPDLLVADVRMPGISGPQLAARLRTVRPDLPVLFISGYAGRELPSRWLDQAATMFLRKPFTPVELLGAVGRLRRRAAAAGNPLPH